MAVASLSSGSNGFEVLTGDNYERWSVLMKNYLRSEGLWDIISDVNDEHQKEDWERRNAKALYAIQLACGPDYFKRISETEHARDAWTCLANLLLPKPQPHWRGVPTDSGVGDNDLHRFAQRGFWYPIKIEIMSDRDKAFECNSSGRTLLHVAVIAGQEHIVEKLVNKLQGGEERLLTMQDNDGYTALALVAQLNGNMRMASCMIGKNENLLTTKTKDGQIPLVLASARGHKQLTRYLFSLTDPDKLKENEWSYAMILFRNCVTAKIFDVALKVPAAGMPRTAKHLLYEAYDLMAPLLALANMPSVFPSGCPLNWWQRLIYEILEPKTDQDPHNPMSIRTISQTQQDEGQELTTSAGSFSQKVSKLLGKWVRPVLRVTPESILVKVPVIKEIYNTKLDHIRLDDMLNWLYGPVTRMDETEFRESSAYEAMLQAAKHGIIEFIEIMSAANPSLLWATDKNKRGVISHAILNRQEKLMYLLRSADTKNQMIAAEQDVFGNNILHQAAELGPFSDLDRRFGAVLQMQREIRWFKEVESYADPMCKEATNAKGKMPHEVFTGSHGELVEAGEKWAKGAASSFTIVCTLIITITFAAAFTVPGGNNQDTGFPIFLKRTLFEVFAMADAVSLITSSSSVLISIVILTSRYTEQDFVTRLPLMLMANLFFLFMSAVAMMVAFCAGIAMMLRGYRSWVIAIISFASLPIVIFVPTQLPLFFQIAKSTIGLKGLASILLLPYNVFIVILISPFVLFIYMMKKIKWLWDFLRYEGFYMDRCLRLSWKYLTRVKCLVIKCCHEKCDTSI